MKLLSKIMLLAALCLLLTTTMAAGYDDIVTMTLAGKQDIPVKIYNPLPGRDRIELTLETGGEIMAWYVDRPMQKSFTQVIPGDTNVSKYITVRPTSRWQGGEGWFKAIATSQETGLNNSKEVKVEINNPDRGLLQSAPGLSWAELLALAVMGSLVSLIVSRGQ